MSLRPDDPSEQRQLHIETETLEQSESGTKGACDYATAILESIPPLLVLDSQLRVQSANQSFCEHFQVARAQTENCLVYDLGNGQWNIPQLRAFLEEVLPRHTFFQDFEVTHTFESIGLRTIRLSGRKVDHLQRILLFVNDVTDTLRSQDAMRVSEVRYRRLFEAARDGIFILDPETRRIADANPFMSELLGYQREELLGKELWEIGLLKDEEASRAAFRELHDHGFIRYEDLPLQTNTGARREVEFVSNLYQENGHKVIQCNIRDITERKSAEEALKAARNQLADRATQLEALVAARTHELRETIEELEAFCYGLSHDLRAPLRAMRGFARIVLQQQREKLDPEGLKYLDKIDNAAGRMDALIQEVLTCTRTAPASMKVGPIDTDKLVHQILENYPQFQPAEADIRIDGELPTVIGNGASLSLCVSNLLTNATKFTPQGARPRIQIRAEAIGSQIRLWVEDNGIGIAPADQQRIFNMFERVHPEGAYPGTGIGLTIVRKAAERMGGSVGVHSAIGQGSKFWLQLRKG